MFNNDYTITTHYFNKINFPLHNLKFFFNFMYIIQVGTKRIHYRNVSDIYVSTRI